MLAALKPLSANSDNAAAKIDSRVARDRCCSARFLVREAPAASRPFVDLLAMPPDYHSARCLAQRPSHLPSPGHLPLQSHLPSNVIAGGSISASKALAVLAKPRRASAPL